MSERDGELFGVSEGVIVVGDDATADDLEARGVPTQRVAWAPPAGGDERLARILDALT